ncbi:hypothetical protein ULMS_09200 [Patiriisocius marinistellae]|uniref:Tetratricopeptide repeat protein n=1 Tax=Patiriisocius marinistellae TaxID=2494560 RepID=A0A5J4FW57_9FLAO|nr:hypothetical protein [Patiriisocius marinistellae]GEQ85412.1 hypothetical protein ULMS_09200 [Patiriisocius marinistellae]
MNTEKYTSLLANPGKIKAEDLPTLNSIVDSYPYFQSARALLLKGLKAEGSFRYNDTLKVTAAHTTNRDILFDYITSKTFEQNEISKQVLQHDVAANEIEVVLEDVSEKVSLALDKQMKQELQKAEAILDPTLFERKAKDVQQLLTLKELQARASEILKGEDKSVDDTKIEAKANIENVSKKIEFSEKEEINTEVELNEINLNAGISEEKIEVDAPLQFKKEDTHSFSEWLKLTQAKPIERSIVETVNEDHVSEEKKENKIDENDDDEKIRKFQLIDKFIQDRPKIVPQEKNSLQKNTTTPFVESSNSLMTETLAKVYLQQKNYKKAIQAYKILILKNPEKSGFFADQIRAVEKLINKEDS